MKRIKILAIILLIALTQSAFSQNREITGKVTNADTGNPIAGVSITAKGSSIGTVTDQKGIYKINVPETVKILIFSYSGMIAKEIAVGKSNTINVALQTKTIEEEEDEIYESIELKSESAKKTCAKGRRNKTRNYSNAIISRSDTPAPDYNTEAYDKINENVFKSAMTNPLSTFSVDVDNASYSNIRRFLNNSQMPYKDAIRIEEMINYFDYDYSQPKDEHPFSISMEMGECYWNKEHYLVQIGLQGKDVPVDNIPASNLVFLIDVSGSMDSPNKLHLLKQAFKVLMDKLRSEDKVAIVVYAGAAGLVLPSTSCIEKTKITGAFNALQAGGSTAGGEGIELAYKIAKENFIKDGNNRVILATDGDFNVGNSSDAAMERLIEKKRDDGIFLTVLGFGMGNYKDSKMEKLSNAGNGNYAYIDNILEAKKVLGKETWGTLFTIAKDVKIQVEFNPAKVKGYRLIGYENRVMANEDFNDDKKDAGDIGSGHTVTALYEIIPAGSDEKIPGTDELEYQTTNLKKSKNLMTVKLRYKEPDQDSSKLIINRIKEKDIKTTNLSDNYKFASSVAEFGMLLRDSEFKGTASYKETLALAKEAKGKDNDGYRAEFTRLVEIAEGLQK